MGRTMLYLSRRDVESVGLPMTEIIEAIEAMFREKGEGRVQMPPKPGVHPTTDGFIHAMPAFVPAADAAGLKWVSAYPENKAKGLPYVAGLIVMNDPASGLPLAVMDCTWVTAMRTAAATAVAARHLARPDSRRIGIVACGVQGRSNLEALSCLFDIERVHAYDHRITNAQRYAEEERARLGLDVHPVADLEDAVRGMDIVVTSGPILKDPQPSIPEGWLESGAFACALDFDSYWTPAALQAADRFVTDDVAQLEYLRTTGYFRETPRAVTDLGHIVAGEARGRETDEERTIAMNLGLAAEDVVTGIEIYRRARERGIGIELEL